MSSEERVDHKGPGRETREIGVVPLLLLEMTSSRTFCRLRKEQDGR